MSENQNNFIALIWQNPTGYIGEPSPHYNSRKSFYGVGGLPHAVFGGYVSVIGGGVPMYGYYLNAYNQIIGADSPLTIELEFTGHDPENYLIQTQIEITGNLDTDNNQVIFLLTRDISSEYFSSVVYYSETEFTQSVQGQSGNYSLIIPRDDSWNDEDLKAVVLVQTFDNDPGYQQHRILQAQVSEFQEAPQAGLEVISPNGGEDFAIGESNLINWESTNAGNVVKLHLYRDDDLYRIISNGTYNDGSFNWFVHSSYQAGNDFRIKILDSSNQNIYDFSDDFFSLKIRPQQPVDLKITVESGLVTLTWEPVPGVDLYSIYGSDKPDSGFMLLDTVTGITSWAYPLDSDRQFFQIRAVN